MCTYILATEFINPLVKIAVLDLCFCVETSLFVLFQGTAMFPNSQEIINLIRHWEPNLGFILLALPPFTKNLDFAILNWQ